MEVKDPYRILLACVLLGAPLLSNAVPVTLEFSVIAERSGTYGTTSYNGYLPGEVGVGYFTFDDAQGPLSSDVYGGGSGRAAIDLSFTWLGREWEENRARIGLLAFDGGSLSRWVIGGVFEGDCGVTCVSALGPSDFWVRSDAGTSSAVLHDVNALGFMWGSVSWSIRETPIPAPGVLGLFAVGLLAIGFVRRTGAQRTQ